MTEPNIVITKICGGDGYQVMDLTGHRYEIRGTRGEAAKLRAKWYTEHTGKQLEEMDVKPYGRGGTSYTKAILELYAAGTPVKDIAKVLGVRYQIVYNTVKKKAKSQNA